MTSQTNNSQSQSRRSYARQRPHEVQTGIDSLPIHVNRMPLTDLKIQTEMLIFYFENKPKSIRWCSGKRGLRNGAPYKVSKTSVDSGRVMATCTLCILITTDYLLKKL